MQIHEITQKKSNQLDEAVGSGLGGAVGKTVSGIKNVGSAIASPFKNIAQGYQQGRMDQTISMLADRMNRGWQNYSVQWAKSQGGQYNAPGKGGASAAQSAGQTQGQTQSQAATGTQSKAKSSASGNCFRISASSSGNGESFDVIPMTPQYSPDHEVYAGKPTSHAL